MSVWSASASGGTRRHRALIETLSTTVFRSGPKPGDGARTRLVNNLLADIDLAGAA